MIDNDAEKNGFNHGELWADSGQKWWLPIVFVIPKKLLDAVNGEVHDRRRRFMMVDLVEKLVVRKSG